MFEAIVSGHFVAGHQIRDTGGVLEPLHEHDWQVRVVCRAGELDANDVVIDFVLLRAGLDEILNSLAGKSLNELSALAECMPSAERVAEYIALALRPRIMPPAVLYCVEVEEEPGCYARYYPGGATQPD